MMNKVITISREFGSGGRELGVRLARRLEIPFYDKEIISMAADDSDIAESVFLAHDENAPNFLDRTTYTPFSSVYQLPMSDQIFLAQSKIIKRLAENGPCVVVGRCADMVLEDSVNLFIYARMKARIARLMALEAGADPDRMESRIKEVDRKRKDYYQYYTGNTWGKAQNYHLSLDCGLVGIEGCISAVVSYLEYVK